jgi:hypothetical protein
LAEGHKKFELVQFRKDSQYFRKLKEKKMKEIYIELEPECLIVNAKIDGKIYQHDMSLEMITDRSLILHDICNFIMENFDDN